jgi:hypothetical protein
MELKYSDRISETAYRITPWSVEYHVTLGYRLNCGVNHSISFQENMQSGFGTRQATFAEDDLSPSYRCGVWISPYASHCWCLALLQHLWPLRTFLWTGTQYN